MGAFNGAYSDIPATVLGSVRVLATLAGAGVDPADVDEVYFGNILSAGQGQNVACQVAIGAGLHRTRVGDENIPREPLGLSRIKEGSMLVRNMQSPARIA